MFSSECLEIFLLFIIVSSFGDVHSLDLSDMCGLTNGPGRCVLLRQCPAALEAIKNNIYPQICTFEDKEPVICCAESDINDQVIVEPNSKNKEEYVVGMKSKEKCNYYNPIGNAPFVVGGLPALPKEFTHMAALGFGDVDDIQWQCGGSLISETFVITAAHCMSSIELGPIRWVRLGDLNIENSNDDAQPQTFRVSSRIFHPDYKPPVKYNDIALIQLDGVVTFSAYVNPICLHVDYDIPVKSAVATGWGNTQFAGGRSSHLLKVELFFFGHDVCNRTYDYINKRRLPNGIVDESQLCAGDPVAEKDTCQGDSGGPLQYFMDRFYLIGITSFGKSCGTANVPGVYTRVSHYISWIEKIVWP